MLMFAAEGTAGGGGGAGTTLKEQLTAMEGERDSHKARADKAEADLKAEQGAHGTTKTSLTAAEKARDAEKARADKTETDLKAEQKAHEELKAKDTTATGKAAETLAANRIAPVAKQSPKKLSEQPADGQALHDQYAKLRGRERAAFLKEHGKALRAFAEANPVKTDQDED